MGRKTYRSRRIVGKLKVQQYLLTDQEMREYLLETLPFTLKNLELMLTKYPLIYVKPNVGSQGIGIYKLEHVNNMYLLHSLKRTRSFKLIPKLYSFLRSKIKKSLIIQQGINLEKVEQHPYDVRVMVQRKPRSSWVCTGIFSKVGQPHKIVTNYYQGGKLVTMEKLFQRMALKEEEINERIAEMKSVALKIAHVLQEKQTGMYELGIDLAYDPEGKLWLIEVNSRMPEFYPIKFLDRKMYRLMLAYAKSYGRNHG